MNDQEKQPDQNTPNIPVNLFMEFYDLVENDKKNWADQEEDKMKIQSFFLFGPFAGFFVEFVVQVWIQNDSAYMSLTHSLM